MSLIPPEFVGPFPAGVKPVRDGVYPMSGYHRYRFAKYIKLEWLMVASNVRFAHYEFITHEKASQTKSWYGLTKEAYERALVDREYFEELEKKARELP